MNYGMNRAIRNHFDRLLLTEDEAMVCLESVLQRSGRLSGAALQREVATRHEEVRDRRPSAEELERTLEQEAAVATKQALEVLLEHDPQNPNEFMEHFCRDEPWRWSDDVEKIETFLAELRKQGLIKGFYSRLVDRLALRGTESFRIWRNG